MTDSRDACQLPVAVAAFVTELRRLISMLDPGSGWYGVFARRDPEGIQACLDGREMPPWDVVDALLQDLAGQHGMEATESVSLRLRQCFAPAVTVHDQEISGRAALEERLETMLRARDHVRDQYGELTAAVERARAAGDVAEAERLGADLAWSRDDFARAMARCAELRARIAALPGPAPAPAVKRRPRGTRFARTGATGPAPAVPAPAPAPAQDSGQPATAALGGTRSAAAQHSEAAASAPARPNGLPAVTPEVRREIEDAVNRLAGLRAAGRGGEAHVLLCEAAYWPAGQLPVLATALEGAGLTADVATLLWEVACLPPEPLAAAAAALVASGRGYDCDQLLHQCGARPVPEVAATALALHRAGRETEATGLLTMLVRARTPQEAAAASSIGPDELPALLISAAEAVSPGHRRVIESLLFKT